MKHLVPVLSGFALILASCALEPDTPPAAFDPDPDTPATVAAPPALVAANVSGKVLLFDSRDPEAARTVADDAEPGGGLSRVRVSPDGEHVLYNSSATASLTLIAAYNGDLVSTLSPATPEFDFVDSDNLIYSYDGRLHNYQLSSGNHVVLVPHDGFGCDHFPVVCPDRTSMIFKNQPDGGNATLYYGEYDPVTPADSRLELLLTLSATPAIELADDLDVNWLDPEISQASTHFVFMPHAGGASTLMAWDMAGRMPLSELRVQDEEGAVVTYGNLLSSPDMSTLLFYGGRGVYLCDAAAIAAGDSTLTVETLYESSAHDTLFAAFTPDSRYVVVGTEGWMGMYTADTLERVVMDSSAVVDADDLKRVNDLHVVDLP